MPTHPNGNKPIKRYLRHTRWRGAKVLTYVADFLLFQTTRELALALRQRVDLLLTNLGMLRLPTKGLWELIHYGHHLGIDIDATTFPYSSHQQKKFRSSPSKPGNSCNVSKRMADYYMSRNFSHSRVMLISCFSLSRLPKFYLCELHSVLGDKWGG
jgi:hypothetical protein